jgi:methyl-accepting chemotaxis protein
MSNRRKKVIVSLEAGSVIKIAVIVYASLASVFIVGTIILLIVVERGVVDSKPPFAISLLEYLLPVLAFMLLAGAGLTILLMQKCRRCHLGPGQRIMTALDKMGKGDLGWKITLRRSDGLSEVAASITKASESLADRIGKLQIQARQLIEVENFLIDSMETERIYNPYTLKALRKLKICTSRLSANIEDFQVSTAAAGNRITISRPEPELEEASKA